jgi:hypothetical protein
MTMVFHAAPLPLPITTSDMWRTWKNLLLDVACQLPGWAFLAIGLTVLALTLLVPAYMQNRGLTWQRGLQHLQAQRLMEEEQGYRNLLAALDANDPVLIERLAYHYLRLKPAGAMLVSNRPGVPAPAIERFSTPDAWVQQPMPRVGEDYPSYSPLQSPIVGVIFSPVRVLLLAGGLLCLAVGLIPISRRHPVILPALLRRTGLGEAGVDDTEAAPAVAKAADGASETRNGLSASVLELTADEDAAQAASADNAAVIDGTAHDLTPAAPVMVAAPPLPSEGPPESGRGEGSSSIRLDLFASASTLTPAPATKPEAATADPAPAPARVLAPSIRPPVDVDASVAAPVPTPSPTVLSIAAPPDAPPAVGRASHPPAAPLAS